MTKGDHLGEFEQIVLLAVLRLANRAYGAKIREEIMQRVGRSTSISTIYVTLIRLERKGYVNSWLADPTPVRGGKSKRYFRVEPSGIDALREARESMSRLWDGVDLEALLEQHAEVER